MKQTKEQLETERHRLDMQYHCADQIIRAVREKSIYRAKSGNITAFLAYPLGAHGGIVMIEAKSEQHSQGSIVPSHYREYGYLETLHALYTELAHAGGKDAEHTHQALYECVMYRDKLFRKAS